MTKEIEEREVTVINHEPELDYFLFFYVLTGSWFKNDG